MFALSLFVGVPNEAPSPEENADPFFADPTPKDDTIPAGGALTLLADGTLRCNFAAKDLAAVYLTKYDKSEPLAVSATLWPTFVEALATATRLPRDAALTIAREKAVLFVLDSGVQLYLLGADKHWSCTERAGARAAILRCDALGEAAKAARPSAVAGAKAALPALIRGLKHENRFVRASAASTPGKIGPEVKTSIPALTELLADKEVDVRRAAAEALLALGPEAKTAVLALAELIRAGQDGNARWRAAVALGKMGSEAKSAVPALTELLWSNDDTVRWDAAFALGNMGEVAKEAIPALAEALRDKEDAVRPIAAQALGKMGREARAAVPALTEALRDEFDGVCCLAAEALGKIGPEAKAAIPALIELLHDGEKSVRSAAAEALGRMGPEAKAAIPALTKALHDTDEEVRRAAADALKHISPEQRADKDQEDGQSAAIKQLTAEQRAICDQIAAPVIADIQSWIVQKNHLAESIAELAKREKKRQGWVPAVRVGDSARQSRQEHVPLPAAINEKVVEGIVFQYRNPERTSDHDTSATGDLLHLRHVSKRPS